ncbi:MAG: hypothetical protein ACPLRA_04790, partial [Candidatus Saccharicenans sp.]
MKASNNHSKNRFWSWLAGVSLLLSLILIIGSIQASTQKTFRVKKISLAEKKADLLAGRPYDLSPKKIPVSKIRVMNQFIPRSERPKSSPGKILVKFKPELSSQSTENILKAYQPKNFHLIPKIN